MDLVDCKRWLRLNAELYKTEKVDVFLFRFDRAILPLLMAHARELNIALSLRTNCGEPPSALGPLGEQGLFDVFLTPRSIDAEHVAAWFDACRAAGLPIRLQLQAPFDAGFDAERVADRIAQAGVAAVNVALGDAFLELPPCAGAAQSRVTVDRMNALTMALDAMPSADGLAVAGGRLFVATRNGKVLCYK